MSLTIAEKIFGLSKIWKDTTYNFPFWKKLQHLDWDQEYLNSLKKITKINNLTDYYLELMKFISLLKDGHTKVFMPSNLLEANGAYPIYLNYIDSELVISKGEMAYTSCLFQPIKRINQLDIEEFLEIFVFPYCWHEKIDQGVQEFNTIASSVFHGEPLLLEFEDNKIEVNVSMETIRWHDVDWQTEHVSEHIVQTQGIEISRIKKDIAYIKLPTFMDYEAPKVFYNHLEEISQCKGILFDVRDNRGGNSGNADQISQAFFNGPIQTQKSRSLIHDSVLYAQSPYVDFNKESLEDPIVRKVYDVTHHQHFDVSFDESFYFEYSNRIDLPVVILQNSATYSAAENFLINFSNVKKATLVGTASYGSTGQPISSKLPGNGMYLICSMWVDYPNSTPFHNIGVVPDIEVSNFLEDYRNRYDRILNEGISTLINLL